MKKKLLVLIMSGVMLGTALNSNPLCLAAEQESNTAVAYGDVDKASLTSEQIHAVNVFLENGYDESQISNFTMGFIENLAQDLESDPSKVEINTQVCSFDEVKNVEAAVNMSEEELVDKGGMSRAQAASIKKQIKSLQKMKRSDKKEQYNMSDAEVTVLDKALKPQKNYEPYKNVSEKVTLSSNISSSKLMYSQAVTNFSTSKNPLYKVAICFHWLECYYWGEFSDKVAVAWGGGLNYNTPRLKNIDYSEVYGIWPAYTWSSSIYGSKSPSANETPNVGVTYTFPQTYNKSLSCIARAKAGEFVFNISNSKLEGKSSSVISKYCHKIVGNGGVSISATPAINVTGQYDVTDTDNARNKITY